MSMSPGTLTLTRAWTKGKESGPHSSDIEAQMIAKYHGSQQYHGTFPWQNDMPPARESS